MEKYSVEILELDKIMNKVANLTATSTGREAVNKLKPDNNLQNIKKKLKEVTAAKELTEVHGKPPFGGIRDIRKILKKVDKEMVLSAEEIMKVYSTIRGARKLKKYFQEVINKEDPVIVEKRYKILIETSQKITILSSLENHIQSCFDQYGDIKDDASPKLKSIRGKIYSTENKIRDKLDSIIKGTRYQTMLQERLITRRENRYVVPVKHEYRNSFKGIVHDQSASGMTVFMEPMAIVELNNKLREIKNEEEAEIYRILQQITSNIFSSIESIKSNLKLITYFDLTFARAYYSIEIKGRAPQLNKSGIIKLEQARHPLLQQDPVPIDIEVGNDFSVLVITGPNTGGKTVALKTIGLFVLMVEIGLHVPVAAGTEISLFKNVFADIGDEQSIEQNLSTFSSHINKIKKFLGEADKESLVLMDELGAGTDPKEGAALGISILEKLKSKKVTTVATTHYSQLKSYAYSTNGVENASVEFDIETLRPTYRLIMGVPGGSNAFDIALKLGIPDQIIKEARKLVDKNEIKVDNIIKDLNKQRKKYRELKEKNQQTDRELTSLKDKYEKKVKRLQERENNIIKKAHKEAKNIVRQAEKKTKRIIKDLKEDEFTVRSEVDRKATNIHQELEKIEKNFNVNNKSKDKQIDKEIKKGDKVRVKSVGRKGQVLNIDKENNEATVQAGVMKITAGLEDLSKVDLPDTEKKEMVKKYRVSKSQKVTPSLDLRGERYLDAQRKLDKYIDDAFLAGFFEVQIVHGKGTGALREAVSEVLENNEQVSSFRTGKQEEGGSGVTIVSLKKS